MSDEWCKNCLGKHGWYVCKFCGFAELDHPIVGVLGKDCVGPSEGERVWRPCGLCVPDELKRWLAYWAEYHA